jgi:hypothetical protein
MRTAIQSRRHTSAASRSRFRKRQLDERGERHPACYIYNGKIYDGISWPVCLLARWCLAILSLLNLHRKEVDKEETLRKQRLQKLSGKESQSILISQCPSGLSPSLLFSTSSFRRNKHAFLCILRCNQLRISSPGFELTRNSEGRLIPRAARSESYSIPKAARKYTGRAIVQASPSSNTVSARRFAEMVMVRFCDLCRLTREGTC